MIKPRNFYLKINGKEKKVGELTERGSFVKCVQKSKHFLREGNAYGIAVDVLNELLEAGCKKVILYEFEKDEKWVVQFNVFMAKSWEHQFPGYEKQKFLAKEWWTIYDIGDVVGDDIKIKQIGKKFEPVISNANQLKLL